MRMERTRHKQNTSEKCDKVEEKELREKGNQTLREQENLEDCCDTRQFQRRDRPGSQSGSKKKDNFGMILIRMKAS